MGLFGAVTAGPDGATDKEDVPCPRWDMVQRELVADNEIVENDKCGADNSHQERLVCELSFSLVNSPNRVGEQAAADRDQVSVHPGHRDSERRHIGRDCVRIDREALAVRTKSRRCLSQSVEQCGQPCSTQERGAALLSFCSCNRCSLPVVLKHLNHTSCLNSDYCRNQVCFLELFRRHVFVKLP